MNEQKLIEISNYILKDTDHKAEDVLTLKEDITTGISIDYMNILWIEKNINQIGVGELRAALNKHIAQIIKY